MSPNKVQLIAIVLSVAPLLALLLLATLAASAWLAAGPIVTKSFWFACQAEA